MNKLIDIFSKYQAYFLGLAIFLCLSAVSFTATGEDITLVLQDFPVIMMFLVALGIFLGFIYISIDKKKIKELSKEIAGHSNDINIEGNDLLKELTTRQTEVYDLIMEGKSNKEIMSLLFIEQSTLKSHINQIYKKLEVSNRRELKSK